jgi:hypothetical protein
MSASKKVSFIEQIDKTLLGLEGLQIITYADKTRIENELDIKNPQYDFIKLLQRII